MIKFGDGIRRCIWAFEHELGSVEPCYDLPCHNAARAKSVVRVQAENVALFVNSQADVIGGCAQRIGGNFNSFGCFGDAGEAFANNRRGICWIGSFG